MDNVHFPDKPPQLRLSLFIFLIGGDIGVIVEKCNGEKAGKVFQYRAGTGRAAGVEKQRRHPALLLVFFYKIFQLFRIIPVWSRHGTRLLQKSPFQV